MPIQVRGYLTFRDLIGRPYRDVHAAPLTLEGLLERLAGDLGDALAGQIYDPDTGSLRREIALLVNGRHHTHLPDGLQTILHDGDQVAIFPPLAGG
jgi:MoaD family protein